MPQNHNLVLKTKESQKSRRERWLNERYSAEGRAKLNEEKTLQNNIQGGLNDLAVKHAEFERIPGMSEEEAGKIMEEDFQKHFDQLESEAPRDPNKSLGPPSVVKRYVLRNGKLVQIN